MKSLWRKFKKMSVLFKSYIGRSMLLITILCVCILLFSSNYMSRQMHVLLFNSEITVHDLILSRLNEYLNTQNKTVRSFAEQIYLDDISSNRTTASSAYALLAQNFSVSSSADPDYIAARAAFDGYCKGVLTQNQELLSVSLYKRSEDKCYSVHRNQFSSVYINNAAAKLGDYVSYPSVLQHSQIRPQLVSAPHQLIHLFFRNVTSRISGYSSYVISMPIVRLTDYSSTIGSLLLEFSSDAFQSIVSDESSSGYASFFIFQSNGFQVYASSDLSLPAVFSPSAFSSDWDNAVIGSMDAYVKCIYNQNLDAYILSILPMEPLMASANRMQGQIWTLCLAAVLFCAALSLCLTLRVSHRIHIITETMSKMRDKNFQLRLPVSDSHDDLDEISISFNKMCESLEDYMEQTIEFQVRQKKLEVSQQAAEIRALQAQIRPHFLFNTLETIRMKAILEGSYETGEMVRVLAELFQRQMRSSMVVRVCDEVEFCKLFLLLFQYRHQGQVEFEVAVSPEAQNFALLKNSLQPILENYMLHGYRADSSENRVSIRSSVFSTKNGQKTLCLEIEDNGHGIAAQRLAQLQELLKCREDTKDQGIGLKNVHLRIQMVFGAEYGCSVDSVEGKGTIVRLMMPAITEKELSKRVHCHAD